jgi:2-amino-4-hydroxy-6-hydroxymethyldihydropteridine diphosphokinase
MLRRLREVEAFGLPLLLGTSRKSTIGTVLGDAPVDQRTFGTAASVALAIANGADIFRVHDVAPMRDVARVADAIARLPVQDVVIALGSNLGDRLANLRAAVRQMQQRGIVRVSVKSSVWETPPVPADQPAYLNAVVRGSTHLQPLDLLEALKDIEHALGRRPERRWGPRPIDLDILFYGSERVELRELRIPHERILERAFVLAPLSDVLRGTLPGLDISITDALNAVDQAGLQRVGPL